MNFKKTQMFDIKCVWYKKYIYSCYCRKFHKWHDYLFKSSMFSVTNQTHYNKYIKSYKKKMKKNVKVKKKIQK